MQQKKPIILISLVLMLGLILFAKWKNSNENETTLTLGILQTATHPALDQAREGFIQEINRLTHYQVGFVVQNAEGSLPQAQTIADSFHAQRKISGIFAIATPALQAAAKAEKIKPIFHAAVSYPETLGVEYIGTNVCGTAGRVNTESQAEMIRLLLPEAKSVAIIHNPGEHNSQLMVKEMVPSLEEQGFSTTVIGIHTENEIASAVNMAARKGDMIVIPTDNMLASAITLVAKEALKRKVPLIASDITLVEKGAMAAQGIDYFESGKQSARLAHQVLFLGESPEEIGTATPIDSQIVLNKKIMDELQIDIPEKIQNTAKLVDGGQDAL